MVDANFLVVAATSITTAAAAQIAVILKDRWVQGREGKFSVLHAALFFEEYARQCSRTLAEQDAYDASSGHNGIDHKAIPSFPKFPDDIEWRKIGIRLTQRAFALSVAVESANAQISDDYRYDPPDGGDYTVMVKCVDLGLECLRLSDDLRQSAKLDPAPQPKPEYTILRHLTDAHNRFEENEKRWRQAPEAQA